MIYLYYSYCSTNSNYIPNFPILFHLHIFLSTITIIMVCLIIAISKIISQQYKYAMREQSPPFIPNSSYLTQQVSHISCSVSFVTQKSAQQISKQKKQERLKIIYQLRDKQYVYIVYLKLINLRIKMPLEQQLEVEKEKVENMFGDIERFIGLHSNFINGLNNLLSLYEKHQSMQAIQLVQITKFIEPEQIFNKELISVFSSFFDFIIIYSDYISKSQAILSQLQRICSQNTQTIRKLFIDFQKPLAYYIFLPFQHIVSYKKILEKYIANIETKAKRDERSKDQLKKILEKYEHILVHNLTLEKDQSVKDTKMADFLKKQFPEFENVEILLQGDILIGQKLFKILLIRGGKLSGVTIIKFTQLQGNFLPQIVRLIKIKKQTSIQRFSDTIFFPNRLGIYDYNESLIVRFIEPKTMNLVYSNISIFEKGAILKGKAAQYLYENKINHFNIIFRVVGTSERQNNKKQSQLKHVLEIYDFKTHICQYIFIKISELQALITNICKILQINLNPHPDDDEKFIKNIMVSNDEKEEKKWISIERKLNELIRIKQFRQHSEFLFHKIKVFEGFWQLIVDQFTQNEDEKSRCFDECNRNLKDYDIRKLINIFEDVEQNEKKRCPYLWLKVRDQAQKILAAKSKSFEKKISSKGYTYQQKLQLSFIQTHQANWLLNICFKKLKTISLIKVKVYFLRRKNQQIVIQQQYSQETIEMLIYKISKKIGLGFYKDFCLYSINANGAIVEYDEHQYINDVKDTFSTLYFGKRLYFRPEIEESLAQAEEEFMGKNRIRIELVVGQIIHKMKNNFINMSPGVLKDYAVFTLLYLQKQKIKEFQGEITANMLESILPPNQRQSIKPSQIKLIKIQIQKLKSVGMKFSEVYFSLMNIYHKIMSLTSFAFKICYLKISTASSKVFETLPGTCVVDYQKISIKITEQNKQQSLKISYWDYSFDSIGTLIKCSKKNMSQQSPIWIKSYHSFNIFKKIQIYQKMFEEIREITRKKIIIMDENEQQF